MAYNVKILPTAEQEVDDIVDYLLGHGILPPGTFLINTVVSSSFFKVV